MQLNLSKYMKGAFTSACIFGGSSIHHQRRELDDSPDLVVSTTGRLLDHIHNTKGFTLEQVDVLVLDEADKLLEMGFKDELLEILRHCSNPKRQTLMVSATLNQDIKELAQLALKQPLQFTVSQQQRLADIASLRLTQYLVRLPDKEDAVKGMVVKRKTEGVPAEQEDKDSHDSGEEDESDEEEDDQLHFLKERLYL
jgi:superfamily II DNA/RNA helicase